jgi:predicted MPP superfamily phosphohydrolase
MSPNRLRHVVEGAILLAVLVLQGQLSRWLVEPAWFRGSRPARLAIRTANGLVVLWLAATLVSTTGRAMLWFPRWSWLQWNLGMAIGWAMFICGVFPLVFLLRRLPPMDPSRRRLLRLAHAAAVAAPLAVIGFGIAVSRQRFELKEVEIAIPGLPKDLDGLRLAQLTDIHLGPFLSNAELARVIEMVNQTRPHVALVTGDLISVKGDPLDDCLRLLAGLRAEAGILGCLGNHEIYANAVGRATDGGARLGIEFLRNRSRRLRFGGSVLSIAGVDYLAGRDPRLPAASGLVAPDAVNVLLSHNPNAFPAAARQGFDLTISGHTHGGQVTMEVLSEAVTLIRFFTPYVQGLFRDGPAALYVSRGIGTVGVPVRIGARPEVTLIRLCAI